jgi:hypothetical protein
MLSLTWVIKKVLPAFLAFVIAAQTLPEQNSPTKFVVRSKIGGGGHEEHIKTLYASQMIT